jgi:hypothetical protein
MTAVQQSTIRIESQLIGGSGNTTDPVQNSEETVLLRLRVLSPAGRFPQ